MKHIITRVIVLAAAAVVFGLQANAQVGQQYRAQVPFDFNAGGHTYAAGSYSVGLLSSLSDAGAITLLNRKMGRQRIIGMSRGRSAVDSQAKLTFLRVGEKYSLIAVSTPSFKIQMKKAERAALARDSSGIIEVALN